MKERFIKTVIVDLRADARGFFLQTELRGGIEHAPNAIFRQIPQRSLTTARTRQRKIGAKRFRQSRGIDLDLRHVPVRFRAREKFAIALVDENVEHGFFERRIRRVAMQFPIAIDQIDFDAARNRLTSVDADGRIGEIWACLTIPTSELNDVDVVASRRNETASEITGEPAGLKFELARCAQRKKERAFTNAAAGELFAVTISAGGHEEIMRSRNVNVTRSNDEARMTN